MTTEKKPNLWIELIKKPVVQIVLGLGAAGAAGSGATVWKFKNAQCESLRESYVEQIFVDVKASAHHSVSTESDFKRAIDRLVALRKERQIAFEDGVPTQAQRYEILRQIDNEVTKAELAVQSHPLARAANKRTMFEELVLKGTPGGAK